MNSASTSGSQANGPSLSTEQNLAEPQHAGTSATVEQSNSPSNPYSSSGTINSTRTNSASEDEWNQILNKLESAIEIFSNSNSTEMNTIISILTIAGEDTDVPITQSQKKVNFNSYLTKILSIQSTLDKSRRIITSGIPDIQSSTDPGKTSTKRNPKNPHNDAKPESDDNEDKSSRKQRLLERNMPWFTKFNESIFDYCDPSCKETCQLLWSYNQDISKSEFFIKIAPNSPTGIPSSQWECIFRGNAVDLNQIFTSLHHVIPNEERTGHLGDTEIVFGVSESKKWVTTALELSSAWRRASRAIEFAFSHW